MGLAPALSLGAPGIRVVTPEPQRRLLGVARDAAAFFGVAPRGPARLPETDLEIDTDVGTWLATANRRRTVPVEVTSWTEYRYHFGGFEGPGRLPYAVSAFFANGGRRAWVARIVDERFDVAVDGEHRATGTFEGIATSVGDPVEFYARNEGTWGNRLESTLSFRTRPLAFDAPDARELIVDPGEWVPGGSLLRLHHPGDVAAMAMVDRSALTPDPTGPGDQRILTLVTPAVAEILRVELVIGDVTVIDHDSTIARSETLRDVGFRADHPRWLARVVLTESDLVWAEGPWVTGALAVGDPSLPPLRALGIGGEPTFTDGRDRWWNIVPEDHWDDGWVPGDEGPGDGVHAVAEHDDIGLLVVPDLYEPLPLAPPDDVREPPSLCGPEFEDHIGTIESPEPTAITPGLDGLALDPVIPAHLERIVTAQRAVLDHVDQRRDLTYLLDVPPGLDERRLLQWRTNFDSPFVAAYHPWLDVATPDDARDGLVRLNPSAFAAGIIAEREQRLGIHFGPANQVAVGAVRAADLVTGRRHDELHERGVNVFVTERDGIWLTGARTLSRQPRWRQLSVVRLMTQLRLTLQREMQWAVFEPNGPELWASVRRTIHTHLTERFEQQAFRGATTKEAFFVRCDRTTMTGHDLDNGRMICLVGVAPAEPLEFLIIEIAREADGSLGVESVS